MKDHTLKKVIWAVDVDSESVVQDRVAVALRPFLAAAHAAVEPIFVLSPKSGIPAKQLPLWEKTFRHVAEERVAGVASRCELPGVDTPTVLVNRESSLRSAAELLVSEGKARGADVIAVSTHARHGISRAFLGSFAETILLQSTLPVLVVNPGINAPNKISRVLFPTDFGQPSRRGFEAAVSLSKQLGAKLWLYYKKPELFPAAYPEAYVLYQYVEEAESQLKETGKAWTHWAQNHGIEASFVFDGSPGNVAQAILDFAQAEKIELVSIVAQRGPISSVLLGSVTRHIVRNAQCTVWVQHSKG